MVDALMTQNSELRTMLIKATSHKENSNTDPEEEKKRDDVVCNMIHSNLSQEDFDSWPQIYVTLKNLGFMPREST